MPGSLFHWNAREIPPRGSAQNIGDTSVSTWMLLLRAFLVVILRHSADFAQARCKSSLQRPVLTSLPKAFHLVFFREDLPFLRRRFWRILLDVILHRNLARRVFRTHVADRAKYRANRGPWPVVTAQHPKNPAVRVRVAAIEAVFVVEMNHDLCGF